jgi:serine/threonine protein kinase/tetratricopeptide (TPR) repeat protein
MPVFNWNLRANELFVQALDYLDPTDRVAFLDRACSGEDTLRQDVETLLRAHDEAGTFLTTPHPAISSWHGSDSPKSPERPPSSAANSVIAKRYRLIQPIGEGGMGSVWLGEQLEPVHRLVAVKLIRAEGGLSRRIVARFEVERQAIALMDHPHIAKLLDAGSGEDGSPYFVMEFVRGIPLTSYCDEHRLSITDRLKLLVQVCSAVHHAHQKGVIHRDLKPSNILVESHADLPVPKVIDFGLAKAAAGLALTDEPQVTAFGTIAGTPLYMSPEQAAVCATDIDTRADIYTLGVVLHELLTGTTPLSRESLKNVPADQVLELIRDQEAGPPSSRVDDSAHGLTIADVRRTTSAALRRLLQVDLDWIVLKALSKDRERRYESAQHFAADIDRFLKHEPVDAGPPSNAYRLRKFIRRNRPQVVAAALVALALVIGIVGTTLGMIEARWQAQVARDAEEETLAALRASTSDAIEHLIGSKPEIGPQERHFIELTLTRWQAFAARSGDSTRNRSIRAEGHFQVGALWQRLDRIPEARTELESAIETQSRLLDEDPHNSTYRLRLAETRRTLGAVLIAQGKAAEARGEFEAARDLLMNPLIASNSAERTRSLARAHSGLGTALRLLHALDPAAAEFRQARDFWRSLHDVYPRSARHELATIHNSLGVLLADRGSHDAAIEEYKQSRDHFEALAKDHPSDPEVSLRLAQAHYNLGLSFKQLDRFDEALSEYKIAATIQRRVADKFPSTPRYRRVLAVTQNAIGIHAKAMKRWDEARTAYQNVIDIQGQLSNEFPSAFSYKQGLARAHNNLGNVAYSVGNWKDADLQYTAAMNLHKQLVAQHGLTESRLDLASTYQNVGNLTRDTNKLSQSLECYDSAIAILDTLLKADPQNGESRERLRDVYFHRGEAFKRFGKYSAAVLDFDRAIEYSPPPMRQRLRAYRAEVLLRTGRVAEAVAEADKLTQDEKPDAPGVQPWEMELYYNFACIYSIASTRVAGMKDVYADRAIQLLRKAINLGFDDAKHLSSDADFIPLRDRSDFRKLIDDLGTAKKTKPRTSRYH